MSIHVINSSSSAAKKTSERESSIRCKGTNVTMRASYEVQKYMYLCFIDYTKAFDEVRHDDLLEILQNLDIYGNDLRLIRNLYSEQSAAMRIDGNIGVFTDIRRGVRQGCVFSPYLINVFSEIIPRGISDNKGCVAGGRSVNNVIYADDAVWLPTQKHNSSGMKPPSK